MADEWEVIGTQSSGSFPKISPEVQRERNDFSKRMIENEKSLLAGGPSSFPIDRQLNTPMTTTPTSYSGGGGGAGSKNDEWEIVPEEPKKKFNLGKELSGIGASVADFAGSIAGIPLSGLSGLIQGGLTGDWEHARGTVDSTMDKLTPSSALEKMGVSKDYLSNTGTYDILMHKILSAPSEYITQPIADKYFELTGKALSASILKGTLDIFAYGAAAKAVGSGAKATVRPRDIETLRSEAGYGKEPTTGEFTKQQELNFGSPLQTGQQIALDKNLERMRGLGDEQKQQPVQQGDFFIDRNVKTPDEVLQGKFPMEEGPSIRNNPLRDDPTLPANDMKVGDPNPRQGSPYEMNNGVPDPMRIAPEQLELSLKNATEQLKQMEYQKELTERGSVGEKRSAVAEENTRVQEQAKLTSEGISPEGMQTSIKEVTQTAKDIFRGKGRSQRGAVNPTIFKGLFKDAEKLVGLIPRELLNKVASWHKAGGRSTIMDLFAMSKGVKLTPLQRERLKQYTDDTTNDRYEKRINRHEDPELRARAQENYDSQLLGNALWDHAQFPNYNFEGPEYPTATSLSGALGDLRKITESLKERNAQARYEERLSNFSVVTPEGTTRSIDPFKGPGGKQSGAIRLDNIFKKKGVAQGLVDVRKNFEVETRSAAEVAKGMMEQKAPDIDWSTSKEANVGIPAHVKALTKNPIIKWSVDQTQAIERKTAQNIKSDIEGEKYTTSKLGVETRVPGEEGGLTKFRRYFREGGMKQQLRDMKDIWLNNVGKATLTRESFRTDKQWETYSAMRNVLDKLIDRVNDARVSNGMKKIAKIPNYFPAIWEGDYFVRVKDATGETRQMASANSERAANKLKEALQKQFPDMKVEANHVEKSRYDISDTSAFEEAANILAKEGNSKLASEFNRIYADVMSHRGAGKHGIKRNFVKGFLGMEEGNLGLRNMEHAYESYVTKLNKYIGNIEKAKLKGEVAGLPPEFREAQKNALDYTNNYLDAVRGKDLNGDIVNALAGYIGRKAGLGANTFKRGTQNLSAMIMPMWLLTPRMAISQLVQPTNNLAMLSRLKSNGETSMNPLQAFMEGYSNMIRPDAQAVKGMNWASREGYLDPTINQLLEFKLSEAPTANAKALMALIRAPMSKLEQNAVRRPSFLMYEKALRKTIEDDITRFQKAAEIMDQTMVNYSSSNIPLMYNRLGILGDASKSLKQYSHNAWGQFFDYALEAKNQHQVAPLGWFLGNQIAMSGLKGTVLVAEATAIITAINAISSALGTPTDIDTLEQTMHKTPWLPDALVMGGLSTVIGYDLSTSVSHPGIPQMASAPALDLGVNWAKDTLSFVIKYFQGTATDADAMKAWLANTPAGPIHNWIEELYTPEGGFVPNKNNPNLEGTYQRNPEEKFLGALSGLRSTQREGTFTNPIDRIIAHLTGKGEQGESQARALAYGAKELLKLHADQKMNVIDAMSDQIQNGKEIDPKLLEIYIKKGGSSKTLMKDFQSRMENQNLSPTERPFKRGTLTAEKLHKLEVLKELMDIELRDKKNPQSPKDSGEWEVIEPSKARPIGMDIGDSKALKGKWHRNLDKRLSQADSTMDYNRRVLVPGTRDQMPRADVDSTRNWKGEELGETRI